jgi:hypothetical protein
VPRGAAPGERRGGRAKGTPNRVNVDLRKIAQPYGLSAVAELARLAGLTDAPGAASEATRVLALRELLDRGFGKATQHLAGDENSGPIHCTFEWAPATPQLQGNTPTIEGQPAGEAERRLELVWAQDDAN